MADFPNVFVCTFVSSKLQIQQSSIRVTLTHMNVGTLVAISGGAFQPGYNGTISANGRGYDIVITTHPNLAVGLWTVAVEAYSIAGGFLSDGWVFTVSPGIFSVVPSYLGLRVIFDEPMNNNADLRNPDNYTIDVVSLSGAIDSASVISVTPEAVTNPMYVDLECTDLTHGKDYKVIIPSGVLITAMAVPVAGICDVTYTGISELPRVQSVKSISETEMEVIFTKEVSPVSDVVVPSRYSFNKGLVVRIVTVVAPGTIKLTTTKQTPSELYTLTIS